MLTKITWPTQEKSHNLELPNKSLILVENIKNKNNYWMAKKQDDLGEK